MRGRIFKFKLSPNPINGNMDNFLFNIVMNRPNKSIYLTKGKVKENSLNKNDYIFIQSNGILTHYMKCADNGPFGSFDNIQIKVKDIIKLNEPIKSKFKGQGYNWLDKDDINNLIK